MTEKKHFNTTHGMKGTPEYLAYTSMKNRCNNKHTPSFKDYGGRGIKVCERWLESFENFYEDMGDRPSKKHSLDRIDNDGSYCPENCKWSTVKEQAMNRRTTRLITYKGETGCVSYFAEKYGIKNNVLWNRIFIYKWPLSKALGDDPC